MEKAWFYEITFTLPKFKARAVVRRHLDRYRKMGYDTYVILLANVLQAILHKVLPKAKVKIFRFCNTNNFSKDYFRQQYPYVAKWYETKDNKIHFTIRKLLNCD